MASVPHSSWFCPLKPFTNGASLTSKPNLYSGTFKTLKVSSSLGSSNAESSSVNPSNSLGNSKAAQPGDTDSVKLAFAKAKADKKAIQSNPTPRIVENPVEESTEKGEKNVGLESRIEDVGNQKVSIVVKEAMERANEYKKNKGDVPSNEVVEQSETRKGLRERNGVSSKIGFSENMGKKEKLTVSSIDFMGLDFSARKKSRGLPAGLVPTVDPFPEGHLPEVEILVGDTSKFGDAAMSEQNPVQENNMDLYKPKVSSWGVFPRPNNISNAYGGGRVIHPGEVLEMAEDRAAKEAHTRQLLAAYKTKIGLNINPKLRAECEKALMDGNSLMDLGKLKEALPFYEKVMTKLPFQSELHGLAALQWSICQDSLSRPNEARVTYERLQSHPNNQVSKKARQFMFGFEAMEMMKVKSSTLPPVSRDYQNYFEAFVEDKANYPVEEAKVDENALNQALPYIIFLVSPIFIVLLIAVQRGT